MVLARFVTPTSVTPARSTISLRLGQLAVPAGLGGEVDDHRAGRIASTADPGMIFGAGRPGTAAVVITTSKSAIRS